MEKFEYFSGTPEVGIVPRAPHAGPLLRHVFEQEHGRGGFAGKVTHTYHLYPPTNWLPGETRVLAGAEDPATPPWHGATIASAIPGARLRVIRGAAHLANVCSAAEVTAALLAHLAG